MITLRIDNAEISYDHDGSIYLRRKNIDTSITLTGEVPEDWHVYVNHRTVDMSSGSTTLNQSFGYRPAIQVWRKNGLGEYKASSARVYGADYDHLLSFFVEASRQPTLSEACCMMGWVGQYITDREITRVLPDYEHHEVCSSSCRDYTQHIRPIVECHIDESVIARVSRVSGWTQQRARSFIARVIGDVRDEAYNPLDVMSEVMRATGLSDDAIETAMCEVDEDMFFDMILTHGVPKIEDIPHPEHAFRMYRMLLKTLHEHRDVEGIPQPQSSFVHPAMFIDDTLVVKWCADMGLAIDRLVFRLILGYTWTRYRNAETWNYHHGYVEYDTIDGQYGNIADDIQFVELDREGIWHNPDDMLFEEVYYSLRNLSRAIAGEIDRVEYVDMD